MREAEGWQGGWIEVLVLVVNVVEARAREAVDLVQLLSCVKQVWPECWF